jgi:Arc/MetJ-type ribon-helix-helix transcriptional regulator
LSNISRYVTVSIPKAIAGKIDFLIDELGYWPSRSAFVREACLEKISAEERRLRGLQGSGEGWANPSGGEGPAGGLTRGSAPVKRPGAEERPGTRAPQK